MCGRAPVVLSIMPDEQNISVLHHVVFVFVTHEMVRFDFSFTAQTDQVVASHHFGPNEAAGHIGMDRAGRLDRGAASGKHPASDLFPIHGKEQSLAKNIDDFAPLWATFFNALVEPSNRPLVFHCTGGKDRAGVAAALILLVLGVPEETVIYDHGLSNLYIDAVLDGIYDRIRSMGVNPADISAYFTAPPKAITAVLKHLAGEYGSAASYLINKAGVDEKQLARLREDLLE